MKNLTWQNPEQLFVAQELINKVKSKCCGIKGILIPIISSKFGEREEIRHVNCSWKRILKIASYYSRFGLVTVYWDESNLLLWASCCHKRLPIPFTRFDVEQANREWCQKICDNPFLEHSFREDDNLNKWDYEILQKARKIMEDDDSPK